MLFRNYKFKNLNIRLILCVIVLTIVGILIIGSADVASQKRQIIGLVMGLIVMIAVMLVNFEFLLQYHWIFYAITIILLGLVLVVGVGSHGAVRWLKIGVRFQPSEIAKVFLVLFFAWFLSKYQEDINTVKFLCIFALLSAVPLLLILKEPDFSTTIVTFMVIVTMIFCAGLSKKIVVPIVSFGVPFTGLYILFAYKTGKTFLKAYQAKRILSWLHPNDFPADAYQQQNSIMAIGSGLFFGKGLNNDSTASVKNGNYISEPNTDFIFAVAGEELGFIGSMLIIILIFMIAFECLRTAKKAKNLSGRLLCVGIASIIAYQGFVNISVVTGLMPNTGLTLPFVSYGLTSLLTLFLGIGLVLNVSLHEKRYH